MKKNRQLRFVIEKFTYLSIYISMHSRCTSAPDTELYDKLISLAYIIMQYVLK